MESATGFVDRYQCPGCGHVWATSKTDGSFVKHITPLRKPRKERKRK
jgi:hypothetical protein